jgi:hypothetical protein
MPNAPNLTPLSQLGTLQEVLQTLVELTSAQQEMLEAPKGPEKEKLSRRLEEIREKLSHLLKLNGAQLTGRTGNE